jgi:uncharacterized damage-inducible protein DinB
MSSERHSPDRTGDERSMVAQWLDYHRMTVLRKVDGLDDEQLATAATASSITLGGLLSHLSFAEDYWFRVVLLGVEPAQPWGEADWDDDWDMDWHWAIDRRGQELVSRYTAACKASRTAAASLSLDKVSRGVTAGTGQIVSLRWIYLHMIEETARHNGHADLIRESIDGTVGT